MCVYLYARGHLYVHFNLSVWTQGCCTEAAELSNGSHCIADTWPGVARHAEMCLRAPTVTAKQKLKCQCVEIALRSTTGQSWKSDTARFRPLALPLCFPSASHARRHKHTHQQTPVARFKRTCPPQIGPPPLLICLRVSQRPDPGPAKWPPLLPRSLLGSRCRTPPGVRPNK